MADRRRAFSDVVSFARSGVASIGAAHNTATVTGVSLSSASLVFATIQNQVAGSNQDSAGLWVQAVVPNVAAGSFTIFLSQRVPSRQTLQVGWAPGSSDVLLGGTPAVLSDDTCQCLFAGEITITSPGQETASGSG